MARHVQPANSIAALAGSLAQTFSFGSQYQNQGTLQGKGAQLCLAVGIKTDPQKTAIAECYQRISKILDHKEESMFKAARGALGQNPRCRRAMAGCRDNGFYAESRRCADDRADIMRVGYLVEGENDDVIAQGIQIWRT